MERQIANYEAFFLHQCFLGSDRRLGAPTDSGGWTNPCTEYTCGRSAWCDVKNLLCGLPQRALENRRCGVRHPGHQETRGRCGNLGESAAQIAWAVDAASGKPPAPAGGH